MPQELMEEKVVAQRRWLPILGYEGIYEISDDGEVKMLGRSAERNRFGIMKYPERILRKHLCRGYYAVNLYKDKVHKQFKVHRLVAVAFVDNPNRFTQVNHLDDVKTNNHFSNLSWGTQKDNMRHARNNGKLKFCNQRSGTVISEDLADRIRHVHAKGCKAIWISDLLGVANTTVRHVLSGRTWTHKTGSVVAKEEA